jgi:molecular chaperone DnaK (HSP70)
MLRRRTLMRRRWIWILAVFAVIAVGSTLIRPALAEESSFTTANSMTPAMTISNAQGAATEKGSETANTAAVDINMAQPAQMTTTNTADEDGITQANVGKMAQPINGEKAEMAAAVGNETTSAAHQNQATTTNTKNTVDAAQKFDITQQSLSSTYPQDAANVTQSEVWVPDLTAVTGNTTATGNFAGAAVPIGPEVTVVIKWTMPTTANWTSVLS